MRKGKAITALLLAFILTIGMLPLVSGAAAVTCAHEHGPDCSYAEAAPCAHGHDELCGYDEGTGTPCAHEHDGLCGYMEAAPCDHEHDEACGGLNPAGGVQPPNAVIIASFDPLPDDVLWQGYDVGEITSRDEINLPNTLTGEDAGGNPVSLAVTWQSAPAFDPAVSASYIFSPALPDGYALAADAAPPVISVFMRPEGGALIEPTAAGDEFTVGILKYRVTNENEKKVEVAGLADGVTASGDLNIPAQVTDPGKPVPYFVTSIGKSAFENCSGFTGSLTIPNSVTSIGAGAFWGCSGFTGSLIIPKSVGTLESAVFWYCSGIQDVYFERETPPSLVGSAFFLNQNINFYVPASSVDLYKAALSAHAERVYALPGGTAEFSADGFRYRVTNYTSFSVTVIGLAGGASGSLTIPGDVTYNSTPYTVTSVGDSAFSGCNGFTGTLTIPDSVTSIGSYAFNGCNGFTGSLTISDNVTSIGVGAFLNCRGFTGSLTIPNSVTSIEQNVFWGCYGFTGSLTIPNSVTGIGRSAFENCSGFTGSLTIPDSVTSIGSYAFYGCSGLTGTLTIPNSVTSIGGDAFSGCSGLTGPLTIPNSVTGIGNRAFQNCGGFTGPLTVPDSVTSIASDAFSGCANIKDVYFLAETPPNFGLYNIFTHAEKIYVPGGSLAAYQASLDGKVGGAQILAASVSPFAPSAPQNFAATTGGGYVSLTWNSPAQNDDAVVGYQISKDNGQTWISLGLAWAYTFNDLNSETYYFKVRAYSANMVGAEASLSATPPWVSNTYTAAQTGGTSGTVNSTGIVITFTVPVSGLTAGDITVTSDTGAVVTGELTGSGATWTLDLLSVTTEGYVSVKVNNFKFYSFNQIGAAAEVYRKTDPTAVAFNNLVDSNGTAGKIDTTELLLYFEPNPKSLTLDDITVTGATKVSLTGNSIKTLTIANITVAEGENVTVSVTDPDGFAITPQSRSVAVHRAVAHTTAITVPLVNGASPVSGAAADPPAAMYGSNVNLPFLIANPGFRFVIWRVTAGGVTINNSTSAWNASFKMGDANVAIEAIFAPAYLTFDGQTLTSGTFGAAYSASVTPATGGSGSYTYSASGLPAGLSMSTDGAISGTPAEAVNGLDFTVTACDTLSGGTLDAVYRIAIAKASQTLNASNISRTVGDGGFDLTNHATSSAGADGGSITYAVTTPGAGASISGTTLSYTSAGTATITATAAGGANYNSASATFTLTVSAAPLGGTASISGTSAISQTLTVNTGSVTGGSGAFSYQWKTGGVNVGVNSATYTLTGADAGKAITCVVTRADATGSVTATFDSGKVVPYNITIANIGIAAGDTDVTLSDNTGRANDSITLNYVLGNGGGTATNTLTFTGGTGLAAVMTAGANTGQPYTVTASDAANGVIAITATFLHTSLLPQTIVFTDGNQTRTYGDTNFTKTATGGSGSGAVTYASGTPTVATVNLTTGEVTIAGAGSTTITATKAADATYAAATASYTLTVTNASQAAPSGIGKTDETAAGANNGTITGVTTAMEYKKQGDANYTPITGTTVTGLAPETYLVRYKAKANYDAGADASVTIAAYGAPVTYSISLNPSADKTFTAQTVGYGSVTPHMVTVNNTGSGATGALTITLSGTNGGSFTLSKTSIGSIAVGGSDSFTVKPNDGLPVGTYTATVTVTGANVISKSFYVSFTVNRRNNNNTGGGNGGSLHTPPVTTEKQPNMPALAKHTVAGTVKDKVLTAIITEKMAKDAIAAVKDTGDGIAVQFNVTGSGDYANLSVTFDRAALEALKAAGVKYVQIGSTLIDLTLDAKAIDAILGQTTGNVTASATKQTKLSDAAKKLIGSRPAFDITVKDSKGVAVSDLKGGSATIGIAYKAAANEKLGNLYGVYVDKNGKPQLLTNSSYDGSKLIFKRGSFSVYGVGYKTTASAFTDTQKHWAKDNIDFAVSRGLLTGTSATVFSPDRAVTYNTMADALNKLAGKTVISPLTADKNLTREDMAVVISSYAKATGYTLPVSRLAVAFADDAKISAYAKDAVKAIQQAGIMSGKNNNLFDPQSSATRAEAATILRRFVELIIDEGTARGWVQNDSGQWMYINTFGKAVTGWLTIGDSKYWFDDKGVMASGKWVQIGGKWYYFGADGKLAVNTTIDGYAVGADGARKQ